MQNTMYTGEVDSNCFHKQCQDEIKNFYDLNDFADRRGRCLFPRLL